ncbi:hypothetical protein BT69DRAFT_787110 [Atractiella rhizophila]|nr:hypothetical protein BT69DRAFT_787110 [Atractiella rhizophila]
MSTLSLQRDKSTDLGAHFVRKPTSQHIHLSERKQTNDHLSTSCEAPPRPKDSRREKTIYCPVEQMSSRLQQGKATRIRERDASTEDIANANTR